MRLDWMGEYRGLIEQLIQYCNLYAARYKKELPHGSDIPFSYAQIQVVEYLLENEDLNLNMHGIATRLGITDSTFSKLVSRLVEKELLQKYHIEGNRKDVVIRVTETGRRVYDDYVQFILKNHFQAMFDAAKSIPKGYIDQFTAMLGAGLQTGTKPNHKKPRLVPVKNPTGS